MVRLLKNFGLLSFFLFFFSKLAFAEDITITTYYPSPYGSYRELRANRIAIGDNYINTATYTWEEADGDGGEVDYQADLVVEGNVGIGTPTPKAAFHLAGSNTSPILLIEPRTMNYGSVSQIQFSDPDNGTTPMSI